MIDKVSEIRDEVSIISSEEQDALDNLPEGIQDSERGEAMQEAIDNLDSAVESLEEAEGYLTDAMA